MRPTQPRPPSHEYDLPPDLSFDAPPVDFVAEASPYTGIDVLPEAHGEAFQDARARAKKPGRKPPLDATVPNVREAAAVAKTAKAASVCLSCGASPPEGGDCLHDEVAQLTDAPEPLMAVVRKLQAAVAERHAQERALRRLVAAEVASGRGDLQIPPRLAPLERDEGACARCGHRPTTSRAARRKAMLEAQASFAFAAPAQIAEPAETRVEEVDRSQTDAPAQEPASVGEAPRRARRPRKSVAEEASERAAAPAEAAVEA